MVFLLISAVGDVDGDTVRCRWARGSQECAAICNAFPGAVLNEVRTGFRHKAVCMHC